METWNGVTVRVGGGGGGGGGAELGGRRIDVALPVLARERRAATLTPGRESPWWAGVILILKLSHAVISTPMRCILIRYTLMRHTPVRPPTRWMPEMDAHEV